MNVLARLRRRPVTIGVVSVLVVVAIVTISIGRHRAVSSSLDGVGVSDLSERHWWVLLTSTLAAGSVLQFVLALAAAVFGISLAERLMGSWRTLLAFLVTGVGATGIGILLVVIGSSLGEYWTSSVRSLDTLDPLTPIAGAVAWASAWASPFWRRRIRVLLVAGAGALLLYSGVPADLYLIMSIGIGVLGGNLQHPGGRVRFSRGSRHELRSLLALVNVILAGGPLLTLVSATRYGVLSPLGIAVTGASPRGRHLNPCVASSLAPNCVGELTRMHLIGAGTTLVALLPLLLMLIASLGLLRGRRIAVWALAALGVAESLLSAWYFGILPASGIASAISPRPQHYAELGLWLVVGTLVPLADAVLLVVFRGLFPVRLARGARRGVIVGLAASVVVPTSLYLGFGWALRDQFRPAVTDLWTLVEQLPERVIPISFLKQETLDFVARTPATHVLLPSIGVLFWLILVATMLYALRGSRDGVIAAQDAGRIRALLAAGSGTLGYMATWTGNRLWTSSDGSLGIAYRVVGGVAVTTSDPIGRATDPEAALTEFLHFCDLAAWTPAFYSVHEEWRGRLRARGWSSVPVAEETVIDPRTFSLEGKAMQDVRYAVNRAPRVGTRAVWGAWAELPQRITRQVQALSEDWMSEKDLPELGFTLGGLDELRDPQVLVGVALDEHDAVLAVTSWLPIRRDGELVGRTLDFMRRMPAAGNGTMEFLISDGLLRFRDEGLELASLSGSPLARSDSQESNPLDGVLALVGTVLEPVYGFRSLLRFKRKFTPRLETMYLVVPDPTSLPAVGLAIARCYLPGLTVAQAGRALASRR